MVKKTKVFWNRNEQEVVAQAAYKAITEMDMRPLEAVRHGQMTLPPNRRRPVTALNTVGNCAEVIARIEELRHAGLVEQVKHLHVSEKAKTDSSQPLNVFANAISTFAISFLDQLDHRLQESEKRILKAISSPHKPPDIEPAATEVPDPCDGKPKFVIVGLRGIQATRVQQGWKAHIKLKFIDSNAPIHILKSNAQEADNVFLMRKFISHAHQEAIEDKSKCVLVPGGLSNLQKTLVEHAHTVLANRGVQA